MIVTDRTQPFKVLVENPDQHESLSGLRITVTLGG